MSGFGAWRTPGPAGSPEDPETPGAGPGLPTLPPRRSPSYLDLLRERARKDYGTSQRCTVSTIGMFEELVATRVDAPYYTGIEGRAAICLLLSPEMASTRDDLMPIIEQGANLHVLAWTEGYPLLRTVLVLPPPLDTLHESTLKLTDGNVQEFVVDALSTGSVELHLGISGVDGFLGLRCRGHGLHERLGGAVDELCRAGHPADNTRFRETVDRVERAYPEITSGLSQDTLIILQPVEPASGLIRFEMQF